MTKNPTKTEAGAESCDLCIIGAGAAGLNALFVASEYLGKDDRVVLIERRDRPGGMWTDVYDYARLHQPHPSFTVGDMKWNWSKPAEYLATGAEVASHLTRCYRLLREKIELVELFGHSVTACSETLSGTGATARVECRDESGNTRIIEAKRVIKATGYDVRTADPLALSSTKVVSTTPERLSREVGFHTKTPVYVVGGGKTGMDTAYNLLTRGGGRSVTLINGKGTVFAKREKFFPGGVRRWWSGTLLSTLFRDQALLFDGANEDACFQNFRRKSAVSIGNRNEAWFYGILSGEERDVIGYGHDGVINDYLEDVVDGPHGPEMVLRNGTRRLVPEGSAFVNCTGHLLRRSHAYEPYLSQGGAILAVTPRSMVHFLSTASAYFLTHLFFRGKLRDLPLYEFDGEAIIAKKPRLYHMSLMSLTYMNLLVMMRALPFSVFDRCGLDIDRLYPLHRRALALIDLKLNGGNYLRHCRNALDRMRALHGVRCGPLPAAEARSEDADISVPEERPAPAGTIAKAA